MAGAEGAEGAEGAGPGLGAAAAGCASRRCKEAAGRRGPAPGRFAVMAPSMHPAEEQPGSERKYARLPKPCSLPEPAEKGQGALASSGWIDAPCSPAPQGVANPEGGLAMRRSHFAVTFPKVLLCCQSCHPGFALKSPQTSPSETPSSLWTPSSTFSLSRCLLK
ncbi:uncharacterized protein LOC134148513 isoform X2 [Rhea pennata]|uniref:uncharacterized protein LOC134148513 isoform X2 n=1 Tax=Rhea pennata TaxID=8795 RepID=UPI002E268BE8